MSDAIKTILDAITNAVFAYKPTEKGLAAKKAKRRIACQARKEAADDRESSI